MNRLSKKQKNVKSMQKIMQVNVKVITPKIILIMLVKNTRKLLTIIKEHAELKRGITKTQR